MSEAPSTTCETRQYGWYSFYTFLAHESRLLFDFDPKKSEANRLKHGIDFIEAQALWDDPKRIEKPGGSSTEPRWLVVGRIDELHWTAVITYRRTVIRIISTRRARTEERDEYDTQEGHC